VPARYLDVLVGILAGVAVGPAHGGCGGNEAVASHKETKRELEQPDGVGGKRSKTATLDG
jgi:hypothetical protein